MEGKLNACMEKECNLDNVKREKSLDFSSFEIYCTLGQKSYICRKLNFNENQDFMRAKIQIFHFLPKLRF